MDLEQRVKWLNFLESCVMLETPEELNLVVNLAYKGNIPDN